MTVAPKNIQPLDDVDRILVRELQENARITNAELAEIAGIAASTCVARVRNLVQNAVDFARSTVWIDGEWTENRLIVRIVDDGEGYPPHLLGRIGDPFVRSRRSAQDLARRPEYEGMGLGLFIAKTLLERTGADLSFANASDPFLTPDARPERCGAIVVLVWALADISAAPDSALGDNQPIEM